MNSATENMTDKRQYSNRILIPEIISLVESGKDVKMNIRGCSMLPFLCEGRDKVFLSAVTDVNIKKGSIVLAEIDGHYFLHRIVEIKEDNITLMGDGNLKIKEYCKKENIKAVVSQALRKDETIDFNSEKWFNRWVLWDRYKGIRYFLLKIYKLKLLIQR